MFDASIVAFNQACEEKKGGNMENFTRVKNMYGHEPPADIKTMIDRGSSLSDLVNKDRMEKVPSIVEDHPVPFPLNVGGERLPLAFPAIDLHIGEGTYGHVYSIQSAADGPKAVKFQEHSAGSRVAFVPGNGTMDIPMNAFEQEVAYQAVASSNGLAPVVWNAWSAEYDTDWGGGASNQDVLIMDRLEMILREKCLQDLSYTGEGRGVLEMLDKMHGLNIFHGDLHTGNIMTDHEGEPWVIDFGKSKFMPEGGESKHWCMLHDLKNLFDTLPRRCDLKALVKQKAIDLGTRALGMDFDFNYD